jgi:hypothetical protein
MNRNEWDVYTFGKAMLGRCTGASFVVGGGDSVSTGHTPDDLNLFYEEERY